MGKRGIRSNVARIHDLIPHAIQLTDINKGLDLINSGESLRGGVLY